MAEEVEGLTTSFNRGFSGRPKTAKDSKGASQRLDGEMYKRPEPNPGTPEWGDGYDDGFEGASYDPLPAGGNPQNYRDGYYAGQFDREELDRLGSSNA